MSYCRGRGGQQIRRRRENGKEGEEEGDEKFQKTAGEARCCTQYCLMYYCAGSGVPLHCLVG